MLKMKIYALAFLIGGSSMLSSCSDDDTLAKKLVVDGEKSTLVGGYIDLLGSDLDDNGDKVAIYGIILKSGTLEFTGEDFSGDGDVVFMQLASPSAIELKSGTYTVDISESFLKSTGYAIVIKDYNSEAGMYYETKSGTIKISKSGSTFKITFNFTMVTDEEFPVEIPVSGSYEGKLDEVAIFGS